MALPAKNQAFNNFMFLLADSTYQRPVTGVSMIIKQSSQDGSAFSAGTILYTSNGGFVEVGNGWYATNLSAAELNGNNCVFIFTGSGIIPSHAVIWTA